MKSLLFSAAIAAFFLIGYLVSPLLNGVGLPFGTDGTIDFIQYWSAWRILSDGGNPYDDRLMHAVQVSVGQAVGTTTMMWNPPWVPVLLSPILSLSFERSALLWLFCNLALLIAVIVLTPRALGYAGLPVWLCGLGGTFLPFVDCLKWGQLSLIHTIGVVLFIHFTRLELFFKAGLCIALLIGKPHLFTLFLVPGAIWLYQLASYRRIAFISGVLTGIAILFAVTLYIAPSSFGWWLNALGDAQQELFLREGRVIPVRLWQTATVANLVRSAIWSSTGRIPDWPLWFFPCLGLVLTTGFFYRRSGPIRWDSIAPSLLCCCFLFANYGWFYDQSVFIVAQFSVICSAYYSSNQLTKYLSLGALLAVQMAILAISLCTLSAQHYYVWVPAALLFLVAFSRTSQPPAASEY